MYDVAIIGAGPVGSYAAYRLVKYGLKVIVVEEHPSIGEPTFCAGIVGKELFERLKLPTGSIQNRLNSVVIYSPSGLDLRLKSKKTYALIIDRVAFDREISHMAMDLGASFLISTRCISISVSDEYAKIKLATARESNGAEVKAKACLLATGVYYGLHKSLGFLTPRRFLDCAQTEVELKNQMTEVNIYLGKDIAPYSFGWIVPVGLNKARIGLSTYRKADFYLNNFIRRKDIHNNIKDKKTIVKRRIIPIDVIPKTYNNRILVVGDSAGQVKPITGGGIFYGLLCSDIASETIISAFKKGNFTDRVLRNYEVRWRRLIGFELSVGRFVRQFMNNLGDDNLDNLISIIKDDKSIRRIMECSDTFDWHKDIILSLLKTPALSTHIYKRLLWNILNKNGF